MLNLASFLQRAQILSESKALAVTNGGSRRSGSFEETGNFSGVEYRLLGPTGP